MLVWSGDELGHVASALDRARAGHSTVLIIEADAGLGKTALLAEVVARAHDFQVLEADGLESDHAPFALLSQWDVNPPRRADGGDGSTRVAAQALQDRVDAASRAGPVLLVVDDLHWADPESVEALLWLLRRTSGDRLLVAIGSRPLPPELHRSWQRWISSRDRVIQIPLTGLSPAAVAEVGRRKWPMLSNDLAQRLHEHTGGNPLYLTTLLAENNLADLTTTGMLPAPAVFARSIAVRSTRLSDAALTLMRATCVLGTGWNPLPLVASTAGVDESPPLAQELAQANLVDLRIAGGPIEVRPIHALVRASVYQQTPLPQLRDLHARASTLVASRSSALEHRLAAAAQYDETLAAEMEAYAAEMYRQRSFRRAATFLRWASGITPDARTRERRWLESLYDLVVNFDFSTIDTELDDVQAASDAVWRPLVLGCYAIQQRRYRDCIEALESLAATPVDSTEPRARYRIEVLLAWARLCLGQPTDVIAEGLARAESVRTDDTGLNGLELVAGSQISIRRHGIDAVLSPLSTLPTAVAVPLPATGALAFRGSLRASMGLIREATDDLSEATRRITDGVTDLGAGSFHAWLGYVQWLSGDWGRSRVSLRQAFEIGGPVVHQMTAAMAPLADIGTGRFDEADTMIAQTRQLLTESPWLEACQLFLNTLLVRAHADGTAAEQASALTRLRGTPFELPDPTRARSTLLLNYVPALIWAQRLDEADAAAARIGRIVPAAPWAPAVSTWFRGLVCEARGDGTSALTHLTSALGLDLGLPLYRAHLLSDHARVAWSLGRSVGDASIKRAEEIYARLGATPYLRRLPTIRAAADAPTDAVPSRVLLTEREQDVLTLLVTGMSYAQISRELFITQSTVGYHLGNIYGKAGVTSRHQLSELARRHPHAFGIGVGAR